MIGPKVPWTKSSGVLVMAIWVGTAGVIVSCWLEVEASAASEAVKVGVPGCVSE